MIVLCSVLFAAVQAVTAGWENICAERREYPATPAIWRAPLDEPNAFEWEFVDGAEGAVEVAGNELRVVKTNARGLIVVRATPFAVRPGQGVRFSADLVSTNADVNFSSSALRAHGRKNRSLAIDSKAERLNFWNGGVQTMRSLPCTAPGMSYRKYGQCFAAEDELTPAIVISGAPSDSVWRNWIAEDLAAADKAWPPREPMPDYLPGACDETDFQSLLARDCVHTAEVRRVDGVSRLVVDGEIAAPVIYKVKTDLYRKGPDLTLRNASNFAGGRLDGSAVRLVSQNVDLRDFYVEGDGFSGAAMVHDIRNAMRLSTNSLMVVCLRVNAPTDFVSRHPGEGWIDEKGEPVVGETWTCLSNYGTTAAKFKSTAAPWPSCSSRVWRDWVGDGIRTLVDELRRQGLDKRVVGVHFSGYHDDQMTQPFTDYSRSAQEEYRRMLAEGGLISTNYAYCIRLAANRALNEFARTFKRELGKPAVAIRWCESPFRGSRAASTDVTAFTRCDALDIIVCQPDYRERLPGFPSVSTLPMDSLHLHGKLFLNEYDIRTWVRPFVSRTEPSTKSVGMAADLPMWRTMVRKLVGEADATRMGYWFYDMKGGWYDDAELAADIQSLADGSRRLARGSVSPWRPTAAVVVDEAQILEGEDPLTRPSPFVDYIYADQCRYIGSSGVPYAGYLAEDVLERPELLDGMRIAVFAFFREIDARRAALLDRLRACGVTLVFLSESATRGGAENIGFRPAILPGRHSRRVVAEPDFDVNVTGLPDVVQTREFAETNRPWGARCTVREMQGVQILARYADDGRPALASCARNGSREVYVCEPSGLTPQLFNRLAREAGAYVAVDGGGLQVNMNGDFVSVHSLRPGRYEFRLPFDCRVVNLRTNREEPVANRVLELRLTAGETCRFSLQPEQSVRRPRL